MPPGPLHYAAAMRRVLPLLALLLVVVVACSDDDGDSSTDTGDDTGTTATSVAIMTPEGEIDTEALTLALRQAIVGESGGENWEVKEASVDELVVGPVDGAPEVTVDEAQAVCSATASVAFGELPTVVVTVTDGAGDALVSSDGPGGSCAPVE